MKNLACFVFLVVISEMLVPDVAAKGPGHGFSVQSRIIGGAETTIENHPYQASLEVHNATHSGLGCGAVILNNNYVVTLGQCVTVFVNDAFTLKVRVGSADRETGGVLHEVSSYTVHESFNINTTDYDVAVIKVSEPMVFGDTVQSIPLATVSPPAESRVKLTGWGPTSYDPRNVKAVTDKLHEVELKILSKTDCLATLPRPDDLDYQEDTFPVIDRMLCAMPLEGQTGGACNRDAGGAAVFENTLVGIFSWTVACGELGFPDYLTDVVSLRDWITSKIEN